MNNETQILEKTINIQENNQMFAAVGLAQHPAAERVVALAGCVRVCMCACVHACVYACMHACIHVTIMYACLHMFAYACMHTYACTCACVHVCMHACVLGMNATTNTGVCEQKHLFHEPLPCNTVT